MKIPFDIKYRPQIESGEYKVETRNGLPARIICWDRKHGYPICALVYEKATGCESYVSTYDNGMASANGIQETSDDLFLITPESELSEDERIRKWIYEMLKAGIENDPNPFCEDASMAKKALAYLEKQKEQPTDNDRYMEGYTNGINDTLKDHHPAEWSKEDERILYNVKAYVGFAAGQRGVREDDFKEANDWLKTLPGFITNSNYNKNMVDLVITELQQIAVNNDCPRQYEAEISWLKSLRQPHWKPSKEQIGALNYAYCELFKRKDVGHNILGPLQKLIDDLKNYFNL